MYYRGVPASCVEFVNQMNPQFSRPNNERNRDLDEAAPRRTLPRARRAAFYPDQDFFCADDSG